jgi:hypothetical protein
MQNEFTDSKGEIRPYKTKPLPFTTGMPLFLKIAEIVGATTGSGLGAAASMRSLSSVDFAGLGEALATLPAKLYGTDGGVGLVLSLLSTTERGEFQPDGRIVWAPLNRSSLLDAAYSGNYLEAFDVIAWVLSVNYAPFLTGLWKKWGKQLLDFLPVEPITTATSPTSEFAD